MRRYVISKAVLIAGACALVALGEDSRMGGPVSGFVFHSPTRSIRPIVGVPGSAYLGAMVAQDLDAASVSPLGKSALATRGGQLYFVQGLDTGQPLATPIEGAISTVDRFAWNQNGLSAAVYSADSRQAQILRSPNASQAPGVESAVDLSAIEGAVSALLFDGKRLHRAAKLMAERERREGRAVPHVPGRRRRVRPCFPRPHAPRDDDDREGHAVQERDGAVRPRGLPDADGLSLSLPNRRRARGMRPILRRASDQPHREADRVREGRLHRHRADPR